MGEAPAHDAGLAPWAALEATSRGRRHAEPAPAYRGEFQRDRDRIIHSNAFRRLVYKTQVFVNHEGDLFRTRLTHSLEVAQVARTAARVLGLSEPLSEAISLAHDLGHTPFGHAGQDALNDCMRAYGGFEHNLQSLRVVDELEERYAGFAGLNLTFECREGILKHCSAVNARRLGDVGLRFIERQQPSLEAQLANLADAIAYNNHDVDDGVRAGLITLDELASIPLFARQQEAVLRQHPGLRPKLLLHETIRRMINDVVTDLIDETRRRISAAAPTSIADVRRQAEPLVAFSAARAEEHYALKRFLRQRVYEHERVLAMRERAVRVLEELFAAFMEDVARLPEEHRDTALRLEAAAGEAGRARAVADYIAGMTDRYAFQEHERVIGSGGA
jgi:dGTPase